MDSFYSKELDTSKVLVMSEITWEDMKDTMVEKAKLISDDPIERLGHIGIFEGIDIVIDNDVPNNAVEVYERWMYEAVKIFGRLGT